MATKAPDQSMTGTNFASAEVAEPRRRGQAGHDEIYRPAIEVMLDLTDVRTDSRVLDVAAGTGDQTLFVARRVASPAGRGHTA